MYTSFSYMASRHASLLQVFIACFTSCMHNYSVCIYFQLYCTIWHLASYTGSYLYWHSCGTWQANYTETSSTKMSLSLLLFSSLFLLLFLPNGILSTSNECSSCVDHTRLPNTNGTSIVLACVRMIERSGIFQDDYQTLRRIAYLETNDGKRQLTYRPQFHGGIWAINESAFNSLPATNTWSNIHTHFGINWTSVVWGDLRKPLYSALAARLYIDQLINVSTLNDSSHQASMWANQYTDSTGTSDTYSNGISNLENYRIGGKCCVYSSSKH